MSNLSKLGNEQILEAFQSVKEEVKIPFGKLVVVSEKDFDTALNFIKEHYAKHEPIYKSLNVPWDEQQVEYYRNILEKGMTLMIVDDITEEPIAIRLTNILRKGLVPDVTTIKDKRYQDFSRFYYYCDEVADFYGHLHTEETFHFNGLAVAKKYQNRGVATAIFHAGIELIRNLRLKEAYIKGEGSSNFSQAIYEKAGFELLHEQHYDSFKIDGKVVISNTGENKSIKFYGIKIV